ncbi:MAG: cupin domain-containing protein [Candidatus Lokiarchaeota archaeon]|nr:cupin domain-containing protein [Candidatus Lokiarchaeota archaeon]
MLLKKSKKIEKEIVTKANSIKTTIQWLITKEDGSINFATRRFEIQPEGEVGLHNHPEEHHIYILEGEAEFINMEGEIVFRAVKDDAIFIPSNEYHRIKNNSKEVFVFLCIIPYLK